MKVLDAGHSYELASLDGDVRQTLVFVKRFRGTANHPGTTSQDVLRALIDRVQVLDAEAPWTGNQEIIACYRRALVMHEARALMRKVEKGQMLPEKVVVSDRDGHFALGIMS